MRPLVRSIALLFFALCILEAKEAAADLPPPFCTTEGAACQLAGVLPGGVCKPGMCTRPGGAGATGSGVIPYDCLVCVNPHGGAGGNGAAGGGNGAAGGGSGAASGGSGAAGEGGTSGEGGASGASGMEGASGASGTEGANGDAGANGAAGANGDAGANSAGGSNGGGGSGGSVGAVMLGLGFLALRISRRRQ